MVDPIFADPLAWRMVKAPSLEELETLAETAFRRLPQKFRALCEGLVIRVEDFPTEEVLDELGVDAERLSALEHSGVIAQARPA